MTIGQNPAPLTSNRTLAKGWGVGSFILFYNVLVVIATNYSAMLGGLFGIAIVSKGMARTKS